MKHVKILVVFALLALLFSYSPGAVDVGTDMEFLVGNVTYVIDQTMKFSGIEIADDYTWIELNNTVKIRVESTNSVNITLVYLRSSITAVKVDTKLLEFYANTTAGTVWFNISGFTDGEEYIIYRNNDVYTGLTANSTENISFSNNAWSERLFTVYSAPAGPYGGGDVSFVRESYFTGWTKEGEARVAYIFTGDVVKDVTGYRTIILTSEGSIDSLKNFLK